MLGHWNFSFEKYYVGDSSGIRFLGIRVQDLIDSQGG